MVSGNYYSSVFLANAKKYTITPGKGKNLASQEAVDPDTSSSKSSQTEEADNNRCLNKFLSGENNEINISDILKDFKATMTAIGVPREKGQNIMGQLKAVHLEASKDTPSISQIQSGLYGAAESVDSFISETLGKPSTVVKQWIDAIFLQKVTYTAADPIKTDQKPEKPSVEQHEIKPQKPLAFNPPAKIKNDRKESQIEVQNSIEINNPENNTVVDQSKDPFEITILQKTAAKKQIQDPEDLIFAESKQLYNQAQEELLKGNKDKAIKLFNETITVSSDLQDDKTHIKSLTGLAEIYDKKHDLKTALKYYGSALKLASQNNDKDSMATIHYDIASIYDDLNMIPQALKHYHASLAFDGENDNIDGQALTLNNVASLYSAQNQNDLALEHYRMAYSLASQAGDSEARAHILSNMGTVFNRMEDPQNSIEYYRRSLKVDQENGNTGGYTKTLLNIAGVYENQGQPERAAKCYKKALSLARDLNDANLTAFAYEKLNN